MFLFAERKQNGPCFRYGLQKQGVDAKSVSRPTNKMTNRQNEGDLK